MTQTAPDGEAVLKELAKAARRTGWWVQMGQESSFALVAHVDHLQSTLKESIRLQGEYVAEIERLKAALEPSGATKYRHIGEHKFVHVMPYWDENNEDPDYSEEITVPWTTVKEIMASISEHAASTALKEQS